MEFAAPEATGLMGLPEVFGTPHSSSKSELPYVDRARRNLRQRINGQHLRRT